MEDVKGFQVIINQLKKLQVTDKEAFKNLADKVLKSFDISRATLYRQIGKRVPGVRKRRADAGKEKKPVSKKAKNMVTELRVAGVRKKDALKIVEKKTGRKISSVKAVGIEQKADIEKSSFGSAAKEFIRKILELDFIAPESGLYFKHNGVAFKVSRDYLEDISLVLMTAYSESVGGGQVLKVDRDELVRSQIFHLMQEAMRVATSNFDFELVQKIAGMWKSMKMNQDTKELKGDFEVFEKCIRDVKPDISKREIISLIKKHS